MKKKKNAFTFGVGIGYVTIMMIFAVICLTVFAVLSLRASGSGKGLNRKSADFTAEYYAADTRAKEILFSLDAAAYEARESGFFEDSFLFSELPEEAVISRAPGGFRAEYTVPVNDRISLEVSVMFYDEMSERRFAIEKWKSAGASSGEGGSHLNVWDGGDM